MAAKLEILQPAVAAFGPRSLLATGTVAGSIDANFSQASFIEVGRMLPSLQSPTSYNLHVEEKGPCRDERIGDKHAKVLLCKLWGMPQETALQRSAGVSVDSSRGGQSSQQETKGRASVFPHAGPCPGLLQRAGGVATGAASTRAGPLSQACVGQLPD